MSTSNVLFTEQQIQERVKECATWIDNVASNDYVLCPILQGSYQFASDLSNYLVSKPILDFCGTQRYVDGLAEDLYIYKGFDMFYLSNKVVVLLDVIINTGTTMDSMCKLAAQAGASKVYTATLLRRKFAAKKPSWVGFTISDEVVDGYGMGAHRTMKSICYE